MNTTEEKLIKEFHKIKNKGWIKSVSNSTGSIGITFENELNRKQNSSILPDYYDIEIKCSSRYTVYPITLFSSTFDGPSQFELKRIVEKYGYKDKIYSDKKILTAYLSCQYKYFLNNQYFFKLELSTKEEKLYLCIYDINQNLIEKQSFITFKTIAKHLNIKLKKLALIYGKRKIINNETFFQYYRMELYHLKELSVFIELLNKGIINVSLIARINKSNNHGGKYKNKNLVFSIKRENIPLLFDKIYSECKSCK